MLLFCFAVEDEARPFRRLLRNRLDTAVLVTGMGKNNARNSFRSFVSKQRPEFVCTAGFAGGLNPKLETGAVIFSTADPERARRFVAAGARAGRLVCSERVATTAQEKQALWRQTGADAVEMESEFICSLAREHGIPAATLRVILDPADQDLPLDFNKLMTSEQKLDPLKLAVAVGSAPWKIVSLLRFQKQVSRAATRLAEVLECAFLKSG